MHMESGTADRTRHFLYIMGTAIVCYLFFRFLFKPTLPFSTAFFFAYIARKPILFLEKRWHLPRLAAVLTVTLTGLAVVFLLGRFITVRVSEELYTLLAGIDAGEPKAFIASFGTSVVSRLERLSPALADLVSPRLQNLLNNFDRSLDGLIEKLLPVLAESALSLMRSFPRLFLFFGTFVLAFFYLSCDYEKITDFVHRRLSSAHNRALHEVKEQIFEVILSVLRAYTLLFLLTFSELTVGFLILKLPYALLAALLTAIVDILPVLGAGTVLIPWSLSEFFMRNTKMGLCLLALYGIMTIIRQAAEPKLLSRAVGMHPLATLAALYIGAKLCGFIGLVLFPIAAVILKNLSKRGLFGRTPQAAPTAAEEQE